MAGFSVAVAPPCVCAGGDCCAAAADCAHATGPLESANMANKETGKNKEESRK